MRREASELRDTFQFSAPARLETPPRAPRARPRIGKGQSEYAGDLNSQKVGFRGKFHSFCFSWFLAELWPPRSSAARSLFPALSRKPFVSWILGHDMGAVEHTVVYIFIHEQLNLRTHSFMLFLNA